MDPAIPQVEFSEARRSTNWRSSDVVNRPPARRRGGWVQRRATRSRCQRKIVARDTIRCSRAAWDSSRAAWDSNRARAANTARSAQDKCGLLT